MRHCGMGKSIWRWSQTLWKYHHDKSNAESHSRNFLLLLRLLFLSTQAALASCKYNKVPSVATLIHRLQWEHQHLPLFLSLSFSLTWVFKSFKTFKRLSCRVNFEQRTVCVSMCVLEQREKRQTKKNLRESQRNIADRYIYWKKPQKTLFQFRSFPLQNVSNSDHTAH